ncbi:MAG TPA: ACT domain-containing protein [Thermoanaerobaculia bacterium]|nr:ACT domain-containing protein [Thermoanaerobaculia bacterium]
MKVLDGRFAVCRLDPSAPTPAWPAGSFVSITRTPDELSIICAEESVPEDVPRVERGWCALRVEGPMPFDMVGIAATITAPVAAANISLLLVATFDTDYLLLKRATFERAVKALRAAGIDVQTTTV